MSNLRKNTAIVDTEIFPNMFIACVRYNVNGTQKDILYKAEDWAKFKRMTEQDSLFWVGYNNLRYDNLMCNFWLNEAKDDYELIFALNQYIFGFGKTEEEIAVLYKGIDPVKLDRAVNWGKANLKSSVQRGRSVHYANWSVTNHFKKVIDLLPLNENQGALKNVAMIMHLPSIMESPIPFGTVLDEAGKEEIIKYCWSDVGVTEALYKAQEENLMVRDRFYGMGVTDAHNIGSAKLAETYIVMREAAIQGTDGKTLLKSSPKCNDGGKGTERGDMRIADLMQYKVEYADKRIQELHDLMLNSSFSWSKIEDKSCKGDGDFVQEVTIDSELEMVDPTDSLFTKQRAKKELSNIRTLDGKQLTKGDLVLVDSMGNGYQLGVGGLHNLAPRGRWLSNEEYVLINVDVKSYYPSLMVSNKLSPKHIPNFWRIISAEKDRRFAVKIDAKKPGLSDQQKLELKAEDGGLKLILNSSFGKTKEKFSTIRDAQTHFSVTISGQLMLLKLIDMIQEAIKDAKLINANTDGVCYYIKRSDVDTFRAVGAEWEKLALVELEEEQYDSWVQNSCNNYMAIDNTGKEKSKGADYKVAPTTYKDALFGTCIRRAAFAKMLDDKPIMDTLKANGDYREYFMSESAGGKAYFIQNGKRLDAKKIRFVYTTDGAPLYVQRQYANPSIVAGGAKVTVLLDVTAETFPWASIDYDKYAREALLISLKTVVFNTSGTLIPDTWERGCLLESVETLYKYSAKAYDKFTALGMTLIPKIGKSSYNGVKPTDPSTWSKVPKDKSLGWTLVSGAEYGYLSIDIDKPENIDTKLIEILQDNPSLKVFRGNSDPLLGEKGSVLYRYAINDLKSFDVNATHGFELMYGNNKLQNLYGMHSYAQQIPGRKQPVQIFDGQMYKHQGVPVDAPAELIAYLKGHKGSKPGKAKVKKIDDTTAELSDESVNSAIEQVQALIDCYEVSRELDDTNWKVVLNDGDGHSFVAFCYDTGKIHLTSSQTNFKSNVLDGLNQLLNPIERPIKAQESTIDSEVVEVVSFEGKVSYQDMFKHAVEQKAKVFIQGATGSGKSHSIVEFAWSSVHNEDGTLNGKKIVIVTSDNRNIDQLCAKYTEYDLKRRTALNLEHEGRKPHFVANYSLKSSVWNKLKVTASVVITNHYRFQRKGGLSIEHYDIISWIAEHKPIVLVDEADTMYSVLKVELPLSVRYSTKNNGKVKVHSLCPTTVNSGEYHCKNCTLRCESKITESSFGEFNLTTHTGDYNSRDIWENRDGSNWQNFIGLGAFTTVSEHKILHKSEMIEITTKILKQDVLALDKREMKTERTQVDADAPRAVFNAQQVITDLVDSCHEPMLLSYSFDIEAVEKAREEIERDLSAVKADGKVAKQQNATRKSIVEKTGVMFPYHACNTWTYQGFDMTSLRWLSQNVDTIIMLSATITDAQKAYFEHAIPGLTYGKQTNVYQQLEDLLIITTTENGSNVREGESAQLGTVEWVKRYDGTSYIDSILGVSSRVQREMGRDCHNYVRSAQKSLVITAQKSDINKDGILNLEYQDKSPLKIFNKDERDDTSQKATLVAYARSTLARGINLGEYGIVYTDTQSYKPSLSYDWLAGGASLAEMQEAEQLALVTQSVGRIIRKPQLEVERNVWQPKGDMGARKVIVIHNATGTLGKALAEKLQPLVANKIKLIAYGQVIVKNEATIIKSLERCTVSAEHFIQTGEVKVVEFNCDGFSQFDEIIEKSRVWTDFRKAANLDRFSAEEIVELKAYFKSKKSELS